MNKLLSILIILFAITGMFCPGVSAEESAVNAPAETLHKTQTPAQEEHFAAETKLPQTCEQIPDMPQNPLSENLRITKYDYSNPLKIPIYLHIEKHYRTNGDTKPGEEFTFVVERNVYYNGELLVKRGEKTTAKLTHFIRRGMNGIPSILILEGFQFENLDPNKLDGKFIKRGFDNTLFVLPLKWALTPLYPLGSFSNIIIGCEARISPKDDIIIYYYPEWVVD